MKDTFLQLTISVFALSLASCSLLPPAGFTPTPTEPKSSIPLSGYEPQPADEKLQRDQVNLELKNSSLAIMESYPVQVNAILSGNLSDPCHMLRVVVTPADSEKKINLDAYSVFDPGQVCIMIIQPFNATIPLGSYSGGHYSVYVNGELLGEFDA